MDWPPSLGAAAACWHCTTVASVHGAGRRRSAAARLPCERRSSSSSCTSNTDPSCFLILRNAKLRRRDRPSRGALIAGVTVGGCGAPQATGPTFVWLQLACAVPWMLNSNADGMPPSPPPPPAHRHCSHPVALNECEADCAFCLEFPKHASLARMRHLRCCTAAKHLRWRRQAAEGRVGGGVAVACRGSHSQLSKLPATCIA